MNVSASVARCGPGPHCIVARSSKGRSRPAETRRRIRRGARASRVFASSAQQGEDDDNDDDGGAKKREGRSDDRPRKRKAESTDAVASFLSRRFGLRGGLAWVGVLAFGVISEQIKTRIEIAEAEKNTKDKADQVAFTIADGILGRDVRAGGGDLLREGDLCVINFALVDTKSGVTLFDTSSRKPIAFVYGSPLLELENEIGTPALKMIKLGLDGMRAGGKRVITGFEQMLTLDLVRVSIAPS